MPFYDTLKWWQPFSNFSWDDIIIKNIIIKKILGLTIDNNRDISDHISIICKTANQKLNALFTVSAKMNSDKCMINSFIKSQFSYSPLVWMFFDQKSQQNTRTLFTFSDK